MAEKIINGKKFKTKKGVELSSAYAIISRVKFEPSYRFIEIHLDIFADEETRNLEDPRKRIDDVPLILKGDKFDQYFHKDVLNAANVNVYAQCYQALIDADTVIGYEKDEQGTPITEKLLDPTIWEPDE